MKKIVKLFGIMTIAAALLVSCKPTNDPTNPDAGKNDVTDGSDTKAPGNNGNNGSGGNGGAGNDADEKVEPYKVNLSQAEHNLVDWAKGWGEATNKIEYTDDKLIISCGNGWANTVDISINKDLSKYSKVTVKGFVASWDEGEEPSDIKLELYSSDEAASEICKAYGDKTFLNFNEESKETTIDLAEAGQLYGDKITAKADLSNITKIRINPQGNQGTLTIESIVFSE